jgi:hypothetical protein
MDRTNEYAGVKLILGIASIVIGLLWPSPCSTGIKKPSLFWEFTLDTFAYLEVKAPQLSELH